MSRNTEFEFVSLSTSDLVTEMTTAYESITGKSIEPGSAEALFLDWVAVVINQERAITNYIGNQNIPSRAEGENLDALGELFYAQKRTEASPSTTTVRFNISAAQNFRVSIPKGTRVTITGASTEFNPDNSIYWTTDADAYVPIGSTYVDVPCTCAKEGAEGNGYTVGQINTLVDVFDYYSSCSNTTVSANGADVATDDEFYETLRQSQHAYSTAGSKGAYEYWAKTANSNIGAVKAVRPSAGNVKLYAVMKDGTTASQAVKTAILSVCNAADVRPLTDYVTTADPQIVSYNVTVTYYLSRSSGTSAADIQTAVEKAVSTFNSWQCGKMGRDINPSYLTQLLMNAGVKRCVITAPVYTALSDGEDGTTTPQVASVGTITLTNGGYEDD